MQKASKYFILILGSVKLICTVCWFIIGYVDMFPGGSDLISAFVSKSMIVNMVLLSEIGIDFLQILLTVLPAVLLFVSLIIIAFVSKKEVRVAAGTYTFFISAVDFICSAVMAYLNVFVTHGVPYSYVYIVSLVYDVVLLIFMILFFRLEFKNSHVETEITETKY